MQRDRRKCILKRTNIALKWVIKRVRDRERIECIKVNKALQEWGPHFTMKESNLVTRNWRITVLLE